MKPAFLPLAFLLAACGSVTTIEHTDAGIEQDAAILICDPSTATGLTCSSDLDCVGATECEHPRCNADTGRCIVTAGLEDGQPCSGGVCKDRMCCQ